VQAVELATPLVGCVLDGLPVHGSVSTDVRSSVVVRLLLSRRLDHEDNAVVARDWRCRLWLAAVILAVSTACTGSPDGAGSGETPAGRRTSSGPEQVAAVFDRLVEGGSTARIYEDLRAVLVLVGGRPLVERYYDSSAEATSAVASVTKSVMSVLVGIALDDGAIGGVDKTLSELLPDHAAVMTPDVAAVTLEQVLTMTAGMPADPPPGVAPPPYYLTEDWVTAIVSGGLPTAGWGGLRVCQCRLAPAVRDPGRGDRTLGAGLRAGEAIRPARHRY
jgi:CubicO group peptidase (beta-lactamase class C family)